MRFAELVAVSGAVAATSARSEKTAAIAALLRQLQPRETDVVVGYLVGTPRQGRVGVGWATISKVRGTRATEPTLDVLDVDDAIDRVLTTTGSGSVDARATILRALFSRATAAEQEFLTHLLGGELRQGANEGVMADAIAKAAEVPAAAVRRAAMLSGDLARAAVVALTDGRAGLDAVTLVPGRAVQPMLAGSAATAGDALGELGLASVEWKLDGARIQVHRVGDDVRVFTRNLNDVTERLPEVVSVARDLPIDRFVLDGETLAMHDDARPVAFQDSMKRFGRQDPDSLPTVLRP